MISQAETLHTIAEVGIAVTGFAGIVAAVRAGTSATPRPSVTDPLVVLLGTSLATVFFCFVPEWLEAAIRSPDTVWRVALGLYGAYRLVYTGLVFMSESSNLLRWLLSPVSTIIGLLHLAAAAGILVGFHYFLYLSGLLWGLAVSLMVFARVLSGTPSQ